MTTRWQALPGRMVARGSRWILPSRNRCSPPGMPRHVQDLLGSPTTAPQSVRRRLMPPRRRLRPHGGPLRRRAVQPFRPPRHRVGSRAHRQHRCRRVREVRLQRQLRVRAACLRPRGRHQRRPRERPQGCPPSPSPLAHLPDRRHRPVPRRPAILPAASTPQGNRPPVVPPHRLLRPFRVASRTYRLGAPATLQWPCRLRLPPWLWMMCTR